MLYHANRYSDTEPSKHPSATPYPITVVYCQIEFNETLFRIFIPLSMDEISDSFLMKINKQKTNLI